MNKPYYFKEIVITIIAFFWLLFVATNVNITLGHTYLWFAGGTLFLLLIDKLIFNKNIEITFQKSPGKTFNAILIGLGGWIVLLISSVFVLKFIDPAKANINAIIGLMGATTPALATSKIANLLTFGIAIAYVETQLWSRALEFFSNLFHIQINKQSLKKIEFLFLIGILSLVFVIFHLTAKGLTNLPALVIVFIMMLISLFIVAYTGETRAAVYLHIFANTIASYLMLFATGILQLGG